MDKNKHNYFFEAYKIDSNDILEMIRIRLNDSIMEPFKDFMDVYNIYSYYHGNNIKHKLNEVCPEIIDIFNDKLKINIIEDSNIEINITNLLEYRQWDEQYDNELKFIEYIQSEKAKEDKQTIITEELLIDNGFEYLERESNLTQDYQNQLYGKDNYKVFRKWTNDSSPLKLDIDNGVNNRGTEWYLHIDNDHCESIGSADINNVWEFNILMEVFESKFRL